MGISLPVFDYLCRVIPACSLGPSCITLGRQHVTFSVADALACAARRGLVTLAGASRPNLPSHHPLLRTAARNEAVSSAGTFTDIALFNLLGFHDVQSLDVSSFEGATLIGDLNDPEDAARLGQKFHFVFDGGTLEHVFHVPNALKNIHDLLRVGGCVLHWSPSNNHVDHGFYQFSPTLYYDYYSANRFEILDCQFMRAGKQQNEKYMFHAYKPGSLRSVSLGGLDGGRYEVAFLARKRAESTSNVVPQQFLYRSYPGWNEGRSMNKA
jgi:SAM-dependent methyltransferase